MILVLLLLLVLRRESKTVQVMVGRAGGAVVHPLATIKAARSARAVVAVESEEQADPGNRLISMIETRVGVCAGVSLIHPVPCIFNIYACPR